MYRYTFILIEKLNIFKIMEKFVDIKKNIVKSDFKKKMNRLTGNIKLETEGLCEIICERI